jgi:hypothetical protein
MDLEVCSVKHVPGPQYERLLSAARVRLPGYPLSGFDPLAALRIICL